MKKMILTLITVATASMLLTGCGSSIPMGTDQTVKNTVMEIAKEELCNQLAPGIYQKLTGIPLAILGAKITYADLKENAAQDSHAGRAVTEIDKIVAKAKMSLSNIRTNEVNDKTKMSYSSADLFVDKYKIPIEYTAQLNSEGQVYVEVFGLKF